MVTVTLIGIWVGLLINWPLARYLFNISMYIMLQGLVILFTSVTMVFKISVLTGSFPVGRVVCSACCLMILVSGIYVQHITGIGSNYLHGLQRVFEVHGLVDCYAVLAAL